MSTTPTSTSTHHECLSHCCRSRAKPGAPCASVRDWRGCRWCTSRSRRRADGLWKGGGEVNRCMSRTLKVAKQHRLQAKHVRTLLTTIHIPMNSKVCTISAAARILASSTFFCSRAVFDVGGILRNVGISAGRRKHHSQ